VYKPEIDEVLTRHLGRVAAPKELWERIESPQARMPVPHRARVRALLVLTTLLVFAVVFHKYNMTSGVSKSARAPQTLNASCQLCHAGG
jgi:hypothetical protein